jgi:hypothetical protein
VSPGLPDGIFANTKILLWVNFVCRALEWEMLVYFWPSAQWSEKSVLAKQFNIFQVNEYFLLKFCLEAFYDIWKVLRMLLAEIANIAHKPI